MMNKEEISSKVYEFMSEKLEENQFEYDQDLNEFVAFDSMLLVELILFLEETFDIVIPEDDYDLDNFSSIVKIVGMIEKGLAGR